MAIIKLATESNDSSHNREERRGKLLEFYDFMMPNEDRPTSSSNSSNYVAANSNIYNFYKRAQSLEKPGHDAPVSKYIRLDDDKDNCHILKLGDHILRAILNILAPEDQLNFGEVCTRFNRIYRADISLPINFIDNLLSSNETLSKESNPELIEWLDTMCIEKEEENNGDHIESIPPLLKLNDYSLEDIIKLLPKWDQINFVSVHPRLYYIFQYLYRKVLKEVLLWDFENVTFTDIQNYFIVTGEVIETVVGSMGNDDDRNNETIAESINKSCCNVKKIEILEINSIFFHKLLANGNERLKNLAELSFGYSTLNDDDVIMFAELPKLEVLELEWNTIITGAYLDRLKTIKKLSLTGCRNIKSQHFIDICESLKQLKSLDVRNCPMISEPEVIIHIYDKANYYFLDNKAYTEDDLLVYNIFVYQIPKKVTTQEAYNYFSQFGDVLRLRLFTDNKCSGEISDTQVGFVNFADPVVAANVLQRTNHVMQKKRIFAKACDSWEQPEAEYGGASGFYVDVSANAAANIDLIDLNDDDGPLGSDNNNKRLSNILQLNDDCLEVICKKLQLRDQVRFARVCERFRGIFRRCCKWEHKVFEMNKLIGMTLWDIREFFEMAGNNIERMIGTVPYNYQDRIEFIGAFSPNVKSVNFNCNNIESSSLLKLLEKMNAITDLQLHNFALNDSAVLTLRNLPNLKILMLKWSYELTGKNLDKLTDLRELSLYGCENLQNAHFISICKSLKELKSLDIRHCKMLTTNAYNEMVKHCIKLQVLKISCHKDVHYECVAYLGNLKRLEVHSFTTVRDELFAALAEHRTTQTLEYLEILARNCITYERAVLIARLKQLRHLICPFNDSLNDECLCEFAELENLMEIDIKSCRAITNVGLLVILRKCAHIRRINVERCENVNEAFVFDAIEVLQQCLLQQLEPKELVWFDVYETGILEYILNNNKYRIAEQLIKLSFTNTITN